MYEARYLKCWQMLHFASAGRNILPISEVLKNELPMNGSLTALEVASGSGQHIVHHAANFSHIHWIPSDIEENHINSINEYIKQANVTNISTARKLDVAREDWNLDAQSLDIIINVNLIHIAPISVCNGLLAGAGKYLKAGGLLIFYGPFAENGRLYPQSNVDFDLSLRSRDSSWGIRDIRDVTEGAKAAGLTLYKSVNMPSNNKMYFFKKE